MRSEYIAYPTRTIFTASTSLLDTVFTNGYDEAVYATRTSNEKTLLLRVDPRTFSLYGVAQIVWPSKRNGQSEPSITVFEVQKSEGRPQAYRVVNSLMLESQWSRSAVSFTTDIYQRFSARQDGAVVSSCVTLTKNVPLLRPRETEAEIRFFLRGNIKDDIDVLLAAIILGTGPREWKRAQSKLSSGQLEQCINVVHLRNDKRDDDDETPFE